MLHIFFKYYISISLVILYHLPLFRVILLLQILGLQVRHSIFRCDQPRLAVPRRGSLDARHEAAGFRGAVASQATSERSSRHRSHSTRARTEISLLHQPCHSPRFSVALSLYGKIFLFEECL